VDIVVTFFVGQRYRNRKGEYEVLQFQGDSMKVRYDDGSEQILSLTTQSTIFENIQREEEKAARAATKRAKVAARAAARKVRPPSKPFEKPENSQFYWSLGFLLARHPILKAFVGAHAWDTFKDDFYAATGRKTFSDEEGITVHSPETDKYSYEWRVIFTVEPDELHLLDFGPNIHTVKGQQDGTRNINSNQFIWGLLELGLSPGGRQNRASIESAIPNQYLGSFKEGYSKGLKSL